MLTRTLSAVPLGLEAIWVQVELDVAQGLPSLSIVGLPDQAVREARERVRAALLNRQYALPSQRITVNLAPADLRKAGGIFDLAIALGILAACGRVDPARLARTVVLGELAFDGSVRPVRGVLPIAQAARDGAFTLLAPEANWAEVELLGEVRAVPVRTLDEAVAALAHPVFPPPLVSRRWRSARPAPAGPDLAEVKGQAFAKRALEIAAAGGHHLLLVGPPGAGKSLLAQRLPTLLPPLTAEEALEVTAVYSVAGQLSGTALIRHRPFRAPHYAGAAGALTGGGTDPKPGEISLAHHGVLFLDELPEFSRDAIEALRLPLEEGCIRVARTRRTVRFPARVLLVAAMNPCPCGTLYRMTRPSPALN